MTQPTINHEILLKAVAFAARAHQGQLRKDNRTPYISHPMRVCLVVREIFGFSDPRMLLAAILHDTIEDTTTDFDDVEELVGTEVAHWVSLLSKDKRQPETAREHAYCSGLVQAPWQVRACKLADVYDNLTDLEMLPRQRWLHTLGRMRMYVNCVQTHFAAELEKPLKIVGALLDEREKMVSASRTA